MLIRHIKHETGVKCEKLESNTSGISERTLYSCSDGTYIVECHDIDKSYDREFGIIDEALECLNYKR